MEDLHRKALRCALATVALVLSTAACETHQRQPADGSRPVAVESGKGSPTDGLVMPGIHAADEGP